MSKYIPTRKRQHNLGHAQVPNYLSVYFHRNNLRRIQEALGTKCTTITHVEYPQFELQEVLNDKGEPKEGMFKRVQTESKYAVVAKFRKVKSPILAMLKGTPNDIKAEYYAQLKNDMTDAARERGIL